MNHTLVLLTQAIEVVEDDSDSNAIIYEHFDNETEVPTKLKAFEAGFLQLTNQKAIAREIQRELIRFINNNLLGHIAPEACMEG